jgi:hypothetical protein
MTGSLFFTTTMNKKIHKLFKEDQKDRLSGLFYKDPTKLKSRDTIRLRVLRYLLDNIPKEKLTVDDCFYVGILFQHSPNAVGYRKAIHYAKKGMEMCGEKRTKWYNKVRWLYAAATDRLLIKQGKPQKYGTQYRRKNKGSGWELSPVDPRTTDKERVEYDVPILKEARMSARHFK